MPPSASSQQTYSKVPEAWLLTKGSEQTRVFFVDSGWLPSPDLPEWALIRSASWNTAENNDEIIEWTHFDSGAARHGSYVGQILNGVGAYNYWGTRRAGKIAVVRVAHDATEQAAGRNNIALGLAFRHAADYGADILNASQSMDEPGNFTATNDFEYAYDQGVALIVSAGNDAMSATAQGSNNPWAASGFTLGVAATVPGSDTLQSYSNWDVEVAAPSPNPVSTVDFLQPAPPDYGTATASFGGTSSASPFVAGIAALCHARNRRATNRQIYLALCNTARAIGQNIQYGHVVADDAVLYMDNFTDIGVGRPTTSFTDLSGHTNLTAIETLEWYGVLRRIATTGGAFNPGTNITRSDYALAMEHLTHRLRIPTKRVITSIRYTDLQYDQVGWAAERLAEKGIITFATPTFSSTGTVTRLQFALALAKMTGIVKAPITYVFTTTPSSYTDIGGLTDSERDRIHGLVAHGIIPDGTTFNPTGTVTRGVFAEWARNLFQWYQWNGKILADETANPTYKFRVTVTNADGRTSTDDVAVTPPTPKFHTVTDDFNDGVLDHLKWSKDTEYLYPQEVGGRLRIRHDWNWPGAGLINQIPGSGWYYDLKSSSITVRVYPDTSEPGNRTRLYLSSGGGSGGNARLDVEDGILKTFVSGQAEQSVTYDPVAHAWWRVREAGGIVYCETSPNRVNWTVRSQATQTAQWSQKCQLWLEAKNDNIDPNGAGPFTYSEFDYFNVVAPLPKIETLVDDFNDNSLDLVKWDESGAPDIEEANGKIRIRMNGTYASISSASLYDLNDSSVMLQVTPQYNDNGDELEFYITPLDAQQNYVNTKQSRFYLVGEFNQLKIRATGSNPWQNLTYDPVEHAWWRIRESGGTVYCETSPDTQTWTVRDSAPTPAEANQVEVHFYAGNWESNPDLNRWSEFDNFNVAPSGENSATVSPSVIALVSTVPASLPSAGSSQIASVLSTTTALPAAATSLSQITTPAFITLTTTVPTLTTSTGRTTSPALITAVASAPVVTVGAEASHTAPVALISTITTIPSTMQLLGSAVSPAAVVAVTSSLTPVPIVPAATPRLNATFRMGVPTP